MFSFSLAIHTCVCICYTVPQMLSSPSGRCQGIVESTLLGCAKSERLPGEMWSSDCQVTRVLHCHRMWSSGNMGMVSCIGPRDHHARGVGRAWSFVSAHMSVMPDSLIALLVPYCGHGQLDRPSCAILWAWSVRSPFLCHTVWHRKGDCGHGQLYRPT